MSVECSVFDCSTGCVLCQVVGNTRVVCVCLCMQVSSSSHVARVGCVCLCYINLEEGVPVFLSVCVVCLYLVMSLSAYLSNYPFSNLILYYKWVWKGCRCKFYFVL